MTVAVGGYEPFPVVAMQHQRWLPLRDWRFSYADAAGGRVTCRGCGYLMAIDEYDRVGGLHGDGEDEEACVARRLLIAKIAGLLQRRAAS